MDMRMPLSLDDPKKAFLWDLDVFLIAIIGIFVGIVTRHFVISIFLFFLIAWHWGKLKSGKHQWFFLHWLYWFFPINEKSKRVPQTHMREFLK